MTEEETASTRDQILRIARRRFAEQGYAATSIAMIASDLGTSKAALYYHFRSKQDILDALLSPAVDAFRELVEYAWTEPGAPAVLDRFLAFLAGPARLLAEVGGDPSVLREHGQRHAVHSLGGDVLRAVAGADADASRLLRARIAMAAIREGVTAAREAGGDEVSGEVRREILQAALRALDG